MNKYIISFFGLYLLFFNIPSFSMELIEQQQKNKGKRKESDVFLAETEKIIHKLDSLSVETAKYEGNLSVLKEQIDLQHQNISEIEESKEKIEDYDFLVRTDKDIRKLKIFADSVTRNRTNLSSEVDQIKSQYQAIHQQENKEIFDEVTYNRLNSLIRSLKESKERLSFYNDQIESQVQIISKPKQQKTEKPSIPKLQEGSNSQQQIKFSVPCLKLTDGMITSLLDSVPEIKRIINAENAQIQKTNVLCILLTGLPGTGKTTLAKIIADKLKRKFIKLNPAAAKTTFQNCIQAYITTSLTHIVASTEKYVVLIDEIDELNSPKDNDNPAHALNEQIDKAEEDSRNIIFVGATNNEDNLDRSLCSRFEKFKIDLPTDESRATLLKELINRCNYNISPEYFINTSDYEFDESVKALAQETKNFSIRGLNKLIKKAINIAIDEYLSTQEETQSQEQANIKIINLTKEHMSKALSEIKPQIISAEKTWTEATGIWIKNFGEKQGQYLLQTVVGSAATVGVGWILNWRYRISQEEQQKKQQEEQDKREKEREKREEDRYKKLQEQYIEQKNLEKKQYEEQNGWKRTITNKTVETVISTAIWIGGIALKERLSQKK